MKTVIELKCFKEAFDKNGNKIMNFTKGEIYEFYRFNEYTWRVEDDGGNSETFFDPFVMFKEYDGKRFKRVD